MATWTDDWLTVGWTCWYLSHIAAPENSVVLICFTLCLMIEYGFGTTSKVTFEVYMNGLMRQIWYFDANLCLFAESAGLVRWLLVNVLLLWHEKRTTRLYSGTPPVGRRKSGENLKGWMGCWGCVSDCAPKAGQALRILSSWVWATYF